MSIQRPLYFICLKGVCIPYTLETSKDEILIHHESFYSFDADTQLWIIGAIVQKHNLTVKVLTKGLPRLLFTDVPLYES